MQREIVVFERDSRFTIDGDPELDFRAVRGALPSGSCPLAIATRDGFRAECGQWFSADQVRVLAESQSGYLSE